MEQVLFGLLLFLTIFFVVTQIVMLIVFERTRKSHHFDHLGDPIAAGNTKARADEIIHKAAEKATEILTKAEKEGVDILAKDQKTGETLAKEYATHLLAVEEALKIQFGESAKKAEDEYASFINQIGKATDEHLSKQKGVLEDKSNAMIKRTEELLNNLTQELQLKVSTQVQGELDATKREIEEYRTRRMKVIDERILDMLEDVIRVALEKKLTLAEQSELVYKALEEAKRENAFS